MQKEYQKSEYKRVKDQPATTDFFSNQSVPQNYFLV